MCLCSRLPGVVPRKIPVAEHSVGRPLGCTGASQASEVLKFKTMFRNLEATTGMSKKNNARSGTHFNRLFRNESVRPTNSWKLELAKANEVKTDFMCCFRKRVTCHWANFLLGKVARSQPGCAELLDLLAPRCAVLDVKPRAVRNKGSCVYNAGSWANCVCQVPALSPG